MEPRRPQGLSIDCPDHRPGRGLHPPPCFQAARRRGAEPSIVCPSGIGVKRPIVAALLVALLVAALPARAAAAPGSKPAEPGTPFVIVALVDGVDTAAWLDDPPPFLREAARRGGIGLLSVRSDGPRDTPSAYLTLATGAPSRAGPLAGLALDGDEPFLGADAATVHRLRTDPRPPIPSDGTGGTGGPGGAGAPDPAAAPDRGGPPLQPAAPDGTPVVHLGFWEQDALNRSRPHGSRPGRLGNGWAREGRRAAVLGNADLPGEKRRYGALFAADGEGVVPRGLVGASTLTVDPRFPFGPRTDYAALLAAARAWAPSVDILVVELGDLSRLAPFYRTVPPSAYRAHYRNALQRIDGFLAELVEGVQAAAPGRAIHLWFVVPTPAPAQREAGVYLSAIAWAPFSPDGAAATSGEGGLLRSPSTRRPGLVAGADVAEALLRSARGHDPYLTPVSPGALAAHLPAAVSPDSGPWHTLAHFYRRAATVSVQRPPILRAYVLFVIGVLLGWSAWRLGQRAAQSTGPRGSAARDPRASAERPFPERLLRPALLLVMAVPIALLLVAPLLRESLAANAALIAAVAAALVAASHVPPRGSRLAPFTRLAWAGAALVAADLVRGAPWMKSSFLGYDPIVGARFYGIGNEYMGFLTGSVLVGSCAALDGSPNPRRWLYGLLLLYGAVAFLIFWPDAGANVGGGITAFVSFAATLSLLWNRFHGRGRTKTVLLYPALGAALAGLMAAAAVWDASRGAEAAHWGRFLAAVHRDGWQTAADTVARKVQLNVRLFRFTIWSRVLVLSLALTGWLLWWPPGGLRRPFARHRHLVTGLRGAVVASVVALLVNDSGVVAAATALIPATASLLYLVSQPEAVSSSEHEARRGGHG